MRAISFLSRLEGISTVSWAAMMPFRIRVRKSAIGSVIDMSDYQLDFVMPGMKPLCASWRRHRRQSPNLRYTARGRPQRRQRDCCRVLYFGVRLAATIFEVLAIREVLSWLGYAATGSAGRMLSYCFGRPSRANGRPSASNRANASTLFLAVVVNATSMP